MKQVQQPRHMNRTHTINNVRQQRSLAHYPQYNQYPQHVQPSYFWPNRSDHHYPIHRFDSSHQYYRPQMFYQNPTHYSPPISTALKCSRNSLMSTDVIDQVSQRLNRRRRNHEGVVFDCSSQFCSIAPNRHC